ncbi:PREDICTED: mavicyanin-like [Camelina sativa]|uniref:Mavicyanin-like n=1 Tax=Camelina sativa TaxID=90675 RepID=A0ABM0ZBB8_CAMSA|nr:PREDICTED: mavicyanin-like [Camelina sativa]
MALTKKNMFFTSLLILVTLFGITVGGTVHKVGDSKGWTMIEVDYEAWASSRTFQVGDSLVFSYNNNFHDVTEVTHNDFQLCESSKPLVTYNTGSDSIILTKPGVQQFICGVPGHCKSGQKLQIHVLPASLGHVAAPVPAPVRSPSSSSSLSPANAPQYQHQMAPSPLQSGASKSASWIGFSLLALILAF